MIWNTMKKVLCPVVQSVVWANGTKLGQVSGGTTSFRCCKCGMTGHDKVKG